MKHYMKMKSVTLLAVALAALTLAGCATGTATWQESAKKTVIASTKVYDLAMHIAGSSGVSAAKQAEIVRIANIYRAAATAALDAADINDQKSYDAHVAEFAKAIADLTALINSHASLREINDAVAADKRKIGISIDVQTVNTEGAVQ